VDQAQHMEPASPAPKHTFDVRYAPESDRLLRCREMTQWAKRRHQLAAD